MHKRLMLESILLFLISFYAVSLSLASYTKIIECPIMDFVPIKKTVLRFMPNTVTNECEQIHSSVLCVMMDRNTKVLRSRTLSQREVDLLIAIQKKTSKEEFDELIILSFGNDRPTFVNMLARKLSQSDLIVANKAISRD